MIARAAVLKIIERLEPPFGRHTLEEQKGFARRDLQAISDIVSEQHYITGGRLTVFDFTVAGMLVGFMDNKPATWLSEVCGEFPALRTYVDRIQAEVGVHAK